MESATGQQASLRGWLQDLWLAAIYDDVPDDEVRRWWNSKKTDVPYGGARRPRTAAIRRTESGKAIGLILQCGVAPPTDRH